MTYYILLFLLSKQSPRPCFAFCPVLLLFGVLPAGVLANGPVLLAGVGVALNERRDSLMILFFIYFIKKVILTRIFLNFVQLIFI
jgi:hypothetical protein